VACRESGKALFIEKPGAVRLEECRELVDYQLEHKVPASIDYVMRLNELLDVVRRVRHEGWLGPMQSSTFLNYAQDETLPKGHWFWDRSKSGGIWVEHCVHFFDLYGALAGTPPVSVAATRGARDDSAPGGRVDQVSGAVVILRREARSSPTRASGPARRPNDLTSLAPPDKRSSLLSSVFAVSYLAFGVPVIIAGVAITYYGLRETVYGYGLVVMALAALTTVEAYRSHERTRKAVQASPESNHLGLIPPLRS